MLDITYFQIEVAGVAQGAFSKIGGTKKQYLQGRSLRIRAIHRFDGLDALACCAEREMQQVALYSF
jgi:hypothetical protein